MADTFSRTFDRSVTEWKFDRAVLCEKLRGIAAMLAKEEKEENEEKDPIARMKLKLRSKESASDNKKADADHMHRQLQKVQDKLKTDMLTVQQSLKKNPLQVLHIEDDEEDMKTAKTANTAKTTN